VRGEVTLAEPAMEVTLLEEEVLAAAKDGVAAAAAEKWPC